MEWRLSFNARTIHKHCTPRTHHEGRRERYYFRTPTVCRFGLLRCIRLFGRGHLRLRASTISRPRDLFRSNFHDPRLASRGRKKSARMDRRARLAVPRVIFRSKADNGVGCTARIFHSVPYPPPPPRTTAEPTLYSDTVQYSMLCHS